MAEIITPGIPREQQWPYGRRFECPACGCEFRPRKGDRLERRATWLGAATGAQHTHTRCPDRKCGAKVDLGAAPVATLSCGPRVRAAV